MASGVNAKVCNAVETAYSLPNKEMLTLSVIRSDPKYSWKRLQERTARGEAVFLIYDTAYPSGLPIRAMVLPDRQPGTNKVMCLTTCQICGDGVERAAQDVWQSVICDSPECRRHGRKVTAGSGTKADSGTKNKDPLQEAREAVAHLRELVQMEQAAAGNTTEQDPQ